MKKQTYKAKELALLLGIDVQTIYIAAHKPDHYKPKAGTKYAALWDSMKVHGITWDQVLIGPARRIDRLNGELTNRVVSDSRPLEKILGDLRRRLPGATVTIALHE